MTASQIDALFPELYRCGRLQVARPAVLSPYMPHRPRAARISISRRCTVFSVHPFRQAAKKTDR